MIVKSGFFYFSVWLYQIDAFAVLSPETLCIDNRLLVHCFILIVIYKCIGSDIAGDFVERLRAHRASLSKNCVV